MNRSSSLKSLLSLILGVIALAGLLFSFDWPLIHDAATNHYLADQILRGKTPYLDLFDMNFPGAYLPHLFTLFALGKSDLAWRTTEYLAILFSVWGIWRLCKPTGRHIGLISAFTWVLFHLGNGATYQGQRDWWIALLLVIASVYLLRSVQNKKVRHEDLFFMSACIGAATMIKPFAAVFFPMAFLFHLVRKSGKTNWLKTLTATALGGLIVPICLLTWLFISGGLGAFFDIFKNYSLQIYSSITIPSSYSSFLAYGKGLGILVFVSALAFSSLKSIQAKSDSIAILTLGTLYGLFHFLFQAKGWNYQAYPLFIFLLPLIFSLLEQGTLIRRRSKFKSVAFLLIILASSLIGTRGVMRILGDESLQKIKPYVPNMIADLQELKLEEQSYVQVMDTALGGLHALFKTDLQQASRTLYDFHFQVEIDHPFVQSLREEFISEMNTKKPQAIVILEQGWLAPHDYSRHDSFPELFDLIKSDYHLTKDRQGYRIYRRN